MDEVKKHAYWIAMGVLAIAAGIFYLVAVASGANAEIAKKTRDLKKQVTELKAYANTRDEVVASPDEGLPVEGLVKYWDTRKASTEAEVSEVRKIYLARDRDFEKMFGAVNDKDTPSVAQFTAPFREELKTLKRKYAKLIGDPANADKAFPMDDPKDSDTPEKLRTLQKQFYIARAIAEAVFAKDVDKDRIVEMSFKEVSSDQKGKLVVRVPVEVEIQMPFPNVPKLVSRILRSNVTFDIREIKVETTTFKLPEFEPYGVFVQKPGGGDRRGGGASTEPPAAELKGFDRDVYIGIKDASNPKQKGLDIPEVPEPPVSVRLIMDALDFELDAKPVGKK